MTWYLNSWVAYVKLKRCSKICMFLNLYKCQQKSVSSDQMYECKISAQSIKIFLSYTYKHTGIAVCSATTIKNECNIESSKLYFSIIPKHFYWMTTHFVSVNIYRIQFFQNYILVLKSWKYVNISIWSWLRKPIL